MQDSYNNLINMNFIPKEYFMEKLFGLVPSLEILADDSEVSVYAKDSLGVGNPNMLLNMSVVGIPILFVIMLAVIILLIAAKVKMPKIANTALKKIHSKIMWNSVLRYLIQTYLTFAVSAILAFKAMSTGNTINTAICLASLGYLILFPFFTYGFLLYNQGKVRMFGKRDNRKVEIEDTSTTYKEHTVMGITNKLEL